MFRLASAAGFAVCVLLSTPVSAAQTSWDELIDKDALSYDDPFLDLEYRQLEDLRIFSNESSRLKDANLSEEQISKSTLRLEEALGRLEATGVNAQELLDQRWIVADLRKRAATAVNPEIEGTTVSIGGFAIPAPPAEDGTQVVYLVPERGMCSHVPPPNPNQMIRARISGDWTPSILHEPVRLTGKLVAEETNHVFRIVDGDVPMRASFIMTVEQVETMKDLRAHMRETNPFTAHQFQNFGGTAPEQTETE